MKPTTLCPCGSGRSQIHCCGDHAKSKINVRSLVTWSFIILLGSGIAAIAFSRPQDDVPSPAAGPTPAPIQRFNSGAPVTLPSGLNLVGAPVGPGSTSGSQVPAPINITNPSPWQYDVVTDRHYDPNHAHWHNGPPPADPITSLLGSNSTSGGQVPAPPNIPNPQPGQYDAATDRHYDANHAHWHAGPPPANPITSPLGSNSTSVGQVPAPPNIPNPQPWQYDAATDRYYHADHAHWHGGPPPADPITSPLGSSSTSGSQVSAPPNITNPSPWQYDAATDRHYDPNHAHWHGGPPPPN